MVLFLRYIKNLQLHQKLKMSKNASTTKSLECAAKIIKESHIICFDVDSTAIQEESINELAIFCGKYPEVSSLTEGAMGGTMTFEDSLTQRLNIIQPTQKRIADFIKSRPCTLTNNVKQFIQQLKAAEKQVYLITGNFDCIIEPIAIELGIPSTFIFANKMLFYYNGDYATFDSAQPTAKSGGKAVAVAMIKNCNPTNTVITMIGDGINDLEAAPPADYFIGFGGNVVRKEVFERAQYYVTEFEQLM